MRKKLADKQGSTILLALLFLLVAVMVAQIVLSASINVSGSVKNDRAREQAYLTVSSAAEILRDGVTADGYSKVRIDKYDKKTEKLTSSTETEYFPTGVFSDVLKAALTSVNVGFRYEGEFTITADGLDTVTVEFKMETDYSILAGLELADGGENNCRMWIRMYPKRQDPVVTDGSTTKERTVTTTTYVNWERPTITRKSEEGAV